MNYKEVYRRFFDFTDGEYVPCEVCAKPASDIHHIVFRSRKKDDTIGNLIGLCRSCHNKAHFKETPYLQEKELFDIHLKHIQKHNS